jgi:hypothetical protein
MSDELKNLREAEEFEYAASAPFPRSTDNQWRCDNPHCHALLGLADPETKSRIHIRRGGTPPGADIMIYDLGGVAIRQMCRQCGKENWLTSLGVGQPAQD